jgi:hypothetical protein
VNVWHRLLIDDNLIAVVCGHVATQDEKLRCLITEVLLDVIKRGKVVASEREYTNR